MQEVPGEHLNEGRMKQRRESHKLSSNRVVLPGKEGGRADGAAGTYMAPKFVRDAWS